MKYSTGGTLLEVERDREDLVRTLDCPNCGATPRRRRCYGTTTDDRNKIGSVSHTGRYRAAVAAGLVPAFAGES